VAHLLESMFFRHETPWHGLGVKIEEAPSTEQAIVLAGLNWEVGKKTLVTQDDQQVVPAFATYRKADNKVLGVVGPKYEPLQNRDAFAWFNLLVESGDVSLETAGSLKEGKRVWVLAAINRDPIEVAKDDIVKKYILLSNSHDGTLSVRLGFSPIRVVCNNTLTLAESDKAGSELIRVRHSKRTSETLEKLREVINVADRQFQATADQCYKLLANTQINAEDLRKYIKLVMEMPMDKPLSKPATQTVELIEELFQAGRGNDLPGVKGSYWAAYNAITENLSYFRGRNQDSRLDSLWFGDGAQINRSALAIAARMAA